MVRTNIIIKQNKGFTLVELLVSMALFIIIIVIASQAFNNIVSQASKFSKSEESNIEGIIGLEVMRHDLEQAGFGLPWGFCQPDATTGECNSPSNIIYAEATDSNGLTLNDSPSAVPRAFVAADTFGDFSSDYIGIKGTTLGRNKASQCWTYIPYHNYSSATGRGSRPVSFASNNLNGGSSNPDTVIYIRSNFNAPTDDHLLIVDPAASNKFYTDFKTDGTIPTVYLPYNDQQSHMIYGVDNGDIRMPFNRADFFIKVPGGGALPPFCAPLTGVLYKATVNQADGNYLSLPLLDCVADMQVILGWDTSDVVGPDSSVSAYSSSPSSTDGTVSAIPASAAGDIKHWLTNAEDLRKHLKMIKVYILAQEGKRDRNYSSPTTTFLVGEDTLSPAYLGASLTRNYTLSADQRQFRWKLYRIIVRPKNLVSNQR